MAELPENYKRLIALGITKLANLPDLNDMTDRGRYPMKPWTAEKTVGTIGLIKKHKIIDEESFVQRFQEESKIPLEILTDQVYEHQIKYFGRYRYDKETIFKYTYCCIVINSLQGSSTERVFDIWASANNINIVEPHPLLDEKFHTDRLQIDGAGKVIGFISIKPNSFHYNYIQYSDVFAGLQAISNITGIPWKIYYRVEDSFTLIQLSSLNEDLQKLIMNWATDYSKDEIKEITPILNNINK